MEKIPKWKNYAFDYRISTDCLAVSVQLIHVDQIEKEQQKKKNMKEAKKIMKETCKDMTDEEKRKYREESKQKKREEWKKVLLERKQEKDKAKEGFKKMSKEEKKKITEEKKKITEEKKKIQNLYKQAEFPYLEELNEDQIKELKTENKIYIDPGKRSLLMMMDDNEKFINYTNRTHMMKTKRLKYQRVLENYRR